MAARTMRLYGNKVFGKEVSEYGLENGYLDYRTLAEIVGDMVLNNTIRGEVEYPEDWEIVNGIDNYEDYGYCQIYQDYIISDAGYKFLEEYTDEIVFYNEKLDMYIWGITHFGTSWDYVLTDIKLTKGGDAL